MEADGPGAAACPCNVGANCAGLPNWSLSCSSAVPACVSAWHSSCASCMTCKWIGVGVNNSRDRREACYDKAGTLAKSARHFPIIVARALAERSFGQAHFREVVKDCLQLAVVGIL